MSEPTSQPQRVKPRKAWYLRWWVWVVAGVVVLGAVSGLVNPAGNSGTPGASSTLQGVATSTGAASPAPLDLDSFLTNSGVAYKSARVAAGRASIYVPTEMTKNQAQQIANDTMLYICRQARQTTTGVRAATRVEVTDGVITSVPNYNVAEHPSGFATDSICSE